MAMMLIDQTKDAACKTAEADAIRAKTGGSASLAYDWANNKGFADAIDAIPSGGGSEYEDFTGGNIKSITSTGTQYILTDYLCPLGALFSIKFSDNNITGYEGYFSTVNGSTVTGIQRNGVQNSLIIKFAGTDVKGVAYPGYDFGDPIVVTFSTIGRSSLVSTLGLVICGSYYNGNLESTKGRFTFYGLNIFDGDGNVLKRFRPWLENGVACVKELESGTIYYNSGSGSFSYANL